ncbi:BadF/BadG/BcrA/BcrD ATPase family protein [Herbaspirillum sp. SJZ107]|uniref:BadF/BadG/BcrA/BcrD ATPase family protein n=1 Tax=Herbaspirillum sp. SJZ107 TaxID=2572881 RepID=UPI00114EB26E|nr:BadF/BadG/BcrA/BcrD ATPase family protein [Herbaspirillum sp. SJZ107]TQK10411.1 glucosamine kinase [Herbaspirillum sp. SJZ107]
MIDYLIGVDGGGTGTRVRVARTARAGGGEVARGTGGPSGLALGVANAWNAIQAAVAAAFAEAGIAQPPLARIAIGLGLAGVHNKRWAAEFVAADPGYAALVLETDAYACLLGAHEGAPGAIVAIATGSVGKALYPDGRRRIVGGWGFPAGDEAGGAWIGLRAVNHIQQVLDGRREPGAFADALIAHCGGNRDTLQIWLGQATETDYAALAPLVLDHAGDPVARAILLDAGQEAGNIARALDPDGTLPLALCGGLGAALRDYLPQGLSSRATVAHGDAAAGALRLIARHLDIHPIEPRR